jgi:hypothetical protein
MAAAEAEGGLGWEGVEGPGVGDEGEGWTEVPVRTRRSTAAPPGSAATAPAPAPAPGSAALGGPRVRKERPAVG